MTDFSVFVKRYGMGVKAVQAAINGNQRKIAATVRVWSWMRQLVERPMVQAMTIEQPAASEARSVNRVTRSTQRSLSAAAGATAVSEVSRARGVRILSHAALHANPSVSTSKNPAHAAKYAVGLKEYVQGNVKIKRLDQEHQFCYGREDSQQPFRTARCGELLGSLLVFVLRLHEDVLDSDAAIDVQRCNQLYTTRDGRVVERTMWVDPQILHECEVTFYGLIERDALKFELRMHVLNWDDASIQAAMEPEQNAQQSRLLQGQYAAYGFTPSNWRSADKQALLASLRAILSQLVSHQGKKAPHSMEAVDDADVLLRKFLGDLALRELRRRVMIEYDFGAGSYSGWADTDTINLNRPVKLQRA